MREFEQVLAWLRGLAYPCAPPIGVGEFEVLYASASEVVVWYSPAREGHRTGEVSIPCSRLAPAWEALAAGRALDEATLATLGDGMAGGRWLLAVLAQLPGACVRPEPLALSWAPQPPPTPVRKPPRRRARSTQETLNAVALEVPASRVPPPAQRDGHGAGG
ncbi:MAG: hypothetical protein PVSMB4_00260 [Ktedonobacterales bacterium]